MSYSTALYTTIYPGVGRFLPDWCSSLNCQDQLEFDLWIGVDGVTTETISHLANRDGALHFVTAGHGDTPISLRCRAMSMMAAKYEAIIFTDSDDILEPTRVSAALHGLESADVHGCALGLVDVAGHDLGVYFGLDVNESPDEVIPRNNFLGLSNTAWRSDMLRKCLPAPAHCIALDWLLATRAWGRGAKITFDPVVRMRYRQYGTNTACVVPPFSAEQIIRATEVVTEHYRLVPLDDPSMPLPQRQLLREAADRVEQFRSAILSSRDILDDYVAALNQLPPHRLWWLSVAHPILEKIWNP